VAEHDGAVVVDHLDDRGDLAALRVAARLDDVEGLVEDHELAFFELARIDVRMHVDPHRLAVDDDLRRPVLVRALEDSIGVRRGAQLVHLLLEELDLLLGLLEGVHEPLVLTLCVGELLAGHLEAAPHGLVLREDAVEAPAELG
jgi:hypothetical protein